MPRKTTVEDLAKMVKKSLDTVATKEELNALRSDTEKGFESVNNNMDKLGEQIMHRFDSMEFKIASTAERSRKDSENLTEWVKDVDERLVAVEIKSGK